jgi:hypothetical protein
MVKRKRRTWKQPTGQRRVVPFYARVRCPSCKAKGARQYGRVGMLRYHQCTNCGERFKSYEASDE